MAKYLKRPVEIEAFEYDGDLMGRDGNYYVPEWAVQANAEGTLYFSEGELYIKTLEGTHHASVGDYIIRGVKGELYPCKPDIFLQTYQELSETVVDEKFSKEFMKTLPNRVSFKCLTDEFTDTYDKVYKVVSDSLDKQIPSEVKVLKSEQDTKVGSVVFKKGCKLYKCSNCNVFIHNIDNYCKNCGQKLEW